MGDMVSFPSNGKFAEGHLAIPESGNPVPHLREAQTGRTPSARVAQGKGKGVIVIQEWWGLVEHCRDVADRFAEAGFVALAPDLFHGKQASLKEPDVAGKLMMALNIDEAERDLRGAINYLVSHPAVISKKVGIVGFCMGGALSLFAASKNPDMVGACVVYYGGHPNVKPELDRLRAPVLGFYAEKDTFVTPEKARELQREIQSRGKQMEMHIYPNTDHAFFNDDRPEVYNKEAAEDTWRRMIDFFNKNL